MPSEKDLNYKLVVRINSNLGQKISLIAKSNQRSIQEEITLLLEEKYGSLQARIVIEPYERPDDLPALEDEPGSGWNHLQPALENASK